MEPDEINKICEELWKDIEPHLRRICKIKLGSCPQEAEDVIADVFLAFCNRAAKYGIPQSPKGWIYRAFNNILNSKYRELYRKRKNEYEAFDEEYVLPYKNDISEDVINSIYLNQVMEILEKELKKEELELFNYIYRENLKIKEISNILGLNESAVKQKHYRLCNKIKRIVNENKKIK